MMDRRHFLQASAATAITGALLSASQAADLPLPPLPTLPYYLAIFDSRVPDAVCFSKAAERRGLESRAIRGDVTDLWYSQLHPRWKQGAVPVAGLTAYGALFCLERLAWDHGMRVVYQAAHTRVSDTSVAHLVAGAGAQYVLAGSAAPSVAPTGGAQSGDPWPAVVAAALARIQAPLADSPLPQARHSPPRRIVTAGTGLAAGIEQPMFSWVIAAPRHT